MFPLCLATLAAAQDTRHVTEPTIPPACVVLSAQLQASGNALRPEDESRLDTARIQKALDTCTPGKAVELRPESGKNAFLSGPLSLRQGVTLLLDHGVTLYASRNPRDFDNAPGTCGISGLDAQPCKPLISVTDARNTAIMGDGTIDGRGDRVVMGKPYTWWQQSRAAQPTDTKYSAPRLLIANHADGLVLYRTRFHNAPNFHISVNNTNGFTAWDVHILTPTARGTDARNTDGIDPGNSQNITVTHSWIDNGDDNIAIKANVQHMSVIDNHFYHGHGMSIGSEARDEDGIFVENLTMDHTTNGIRIKSNVTRGGTVRNVVYRNVCMRDVAMPISITPFYTGRTTEGVVDIGLKGDHIPDYKGIRLENVLDLTPGIAQVAGYDAAHTTEITMNGVDIRGIAPEQIRARFAHISVGPMGANFTFTGQGVTTSPAEHPLKVEYSCDGKFLPYAE